MKKRIDLGKIDFAKVHIIFTRHATARLTEVGRYPDSVMMARVRNGEIRLGNKKLRLGEDITVSICNGDYRFVAKYYEEYPQRDWEPTLVIVTVINNRMRKQLK